MFVSRLKITPKTVCLMSSNQASVKTSLDVNYDFDCPTFDVNTSLRYYFEGLKSLETAPATHLKKCAADFFVFLCKLHYKIRQKVFLDTSHDFLKSKFVSKSNFDSKTWLGSVAHMLI